MTQTKKKILIGAGVAIALIILFNLLPDGIRIASTISASAGFVAGIIAKTWHDRKTQTKE